MKNKIKLLQYSENHLFDVDETIYKKIEDSSYILQKVDLVAESCIFIYDYSKRKIIHLTPDELFFTEDELNNCENKNLDLYTSKIVDEDEEFIEKIHNKAFSFLKHQKLEDKTNFSLHYNIRLNTSFRANLLTNVRVNILETDKYGSIWLAMFVLKKSSYLNYIIPYFKNTKTQKLNFFETPKLAKYNFKKIQLETINWLFSSFDLDYISLELRLSPSGLNTRLQNIYNILNVKNRIQLTELLGNLMKL